MRISDWSSDVCSSDLLGARLLLALRHGRYGLVIAVLPHLDDMRGHLEQRNWLPISLAWPRAKQDRVEGGERVRLHQIFQMLHLGRSEERRVGKECVSTFRLRRSPNN